MSKILFWSLQHGQGQSSNLHVIAAVMSLLHKKKVLMMQTHFGMNNLESPLIGLNVDQQQLENNNLFQDIGLDAAVTYSNMNRLNLKILESCCITFPNTSLLLLPGTETKNRETFDRDVGGSVRKMINKADGLVDVVMIDANSGNDELSSNLMQMMDLIVINLTQRRHILEKFFKDYGERFKDNKSVFYLFGDYDDNSAYNINNIRHRYGKYINGNNSGVIPYCTEYMDAQNESNVIKFMLEGLRARRDSKLNNLLKNIKEIFKPGKYIPEEIDYFFHRSRLATEKIFDCLYVPIRKERREGNRT